MKKSLVIFGLIITLGLLFSSCGGSKGASNPKELFENYKDYTVKLLKGDVSYKDIMSIVHFSSPENRDKFVTTSKIAQKYANETAKLMKDYTKKLGVEGFNPYQDMLTHVFIEAKTEGDKGIIIFETKAIYGTDKSEMSIIKVDNAWFISDTYSRIKEQIELNPVELEKELKKNLEEQKKQMQETLSDPKKMEDAKRGMQKMKEFMKGDGTQNPFEEFDFDWDDDDNDADDEEALNDEQTYKPFEQPDLPDFNAEVMKKYIEATQKYKEIIAKWEDDMQNPQAQKEILEVKKLLDEAQKALQGE